jgi:hypothetical protein
MAVDLLVGFGIFLPILACAPDKQGEQSFQKQKAAGINTRRPWLIHRFVNNIRFFIAF